MFNVYREEWVGDFRFVEYEEFQLDRPSYLIVGLPDAGLVSVIAASHIIKKLDAVEVGGIDSYYLPPIAVIHQGVPRPPIRIFAKDRVLIVYSEFLPPIQTVPALMNALLDYAMRRGIDNVICMTGLPIPNRFEIESLRSFFIPSTRRALEIGKSAGIPLFENGYLVGPYALLLKEAMRRRVNTLVLLTESFMEFPDPEASAKNLELFSKISGISIDVKELLEQAEVIRLRAREHMKRVLPGLAQMRKEYEYAPPLYT